MADTNPLDAVPMKETEYDFPQELLDQAQVARSERHAEQPKYNDDLAKVVARADISESEARKAADAAERQQSRQEYETLQRGKVNAIGNANNFGKAFAAVAQDGTPNENAGYVGIADGGITKRMLATDAMPDSVVTIPDAANPGQNALDSDLFEVQEVNGEKGVTLKNGAITDEYLREGSISPDKIASPYYVITDYQWSTDDQSYVHVGIPDTDHILGNDKYQYPGIKLLDPLVASDLYGAYGGHRIYNCLRIKTDGIYKDLIKKDALPYTNEVNTFQYSTPASGVGSITERFNLVDFGILSIVIAQATVSFTSAGTAFMTISKDKVFPSSGYKGVVDAAPSTFQPFLIAESPANPTQVTSGLTHDESNGYRMQMQASASGTYVMTYVLGTIAAERLATPWSWSAGAKANPWPDEEDEESAKGDAFPDEEE